jgi:hypothetical protein
MSTEGWLVTLAIAVFIGGLAVIMLVAAAADRRACEHAGGRVISKTVSGVGITSSGGVATTFSDVSFCISADGRILN